MPKIDFYSAPNTHSLKPFLYLFHYIALFFLVPLIIKGYLTKQAAMLFIASILFILIVFNLLVLLPKKKYVLTASIVTAFSGLALLYMVGVGDSKQVVLFLALNFPLYAVFLMGCMTGTLFALAFMTGTIFIFTNPFGISFVSYPLATRIYFLSSYALILIFSFSYEQIRLHTQQALHSGGVFLKSLIDTIPSPVFFKDNSGCYQGCNKAFEREILGKPESEIIGKTVFDIAPHDLAARYAEADKPLLEGSVTKQTYEAKVKYTDGAENDVIFNKGTFYDVLGNPAGLIGVITRITELKQTERHLALALETAENALSARSEFLANMSHEIRTPMTSILAITDLLRSTPLTPEQKEYVDVLHDASVRLMSLLGNMLDKAALLNTNLSLKIEEFSFDKMLHELRVYFEPKASSKNLELRFIAEPEIPEMFVGDKQRLQRIIVNLLDNAIKFTLQGSVSLQVSCVRNSKNDCTVKIEITDTGIGIEQDNLPKLFDLFWQGDSSLTRQFSGVGLGLPIVRSLVDLMKGVLRVESRINHGSTFTIELPLSVPKLEQVPAGYTQH